jgi:hypothetical protein
MGRLGLEPSPKCGVYFGQLLGMADHLTFTLGKHGYKVIKPTSTLRHLIDRGCTGYLFRCLPGR